MHREQRLVDAEVLHEPPGIARVLGGNQIDGAQDFERAKRDVAEITDGRCNYI